LKILLMVIALNFQLEGPDGILRVVGINGQVLSLRYKAHGQEKPINQGSLSRIGSHSNLKTKLVTPWPKYRYDLQNTGHTSALAPNSSQIFWKSAPLMDVVSSPAIKDDKVFFGTFGFPGWVVCLDLYTGDEIWHFVPPHYDYVNSSPAVAHGRVYIGDRNGYLWCFDEETGDTLWYYHANNGIDGGIVVDDSVVYFGSMRGNPSPPYSIYALDAFTGELLWGYDSGEAMVISTPAILDSLLVIGTDEGHNNVYCFNKYTGDIVWEFSESEPMGWVESSPCIYQGKVYVGSSSGKLYCLDLSTGQKIWEFYTGWWITSSPGAHSGKIFFGAYNGIIYAIPSEDPNQDGIIDPSEVIWTFQTGDLVGQSSPAISSGMVFIGSYDGKVYALDEETGALIWSYQTGESILSSPAISDGILFIGSADDTLYSFGAPTSVHQKDGTILTSLSVYPNPFNNVLKISFNLPRSSWVEIYLYDIKGGLVKQILHKFGSKGLNDVLWVPTKEMRSGIYFLVFKSEGVYQCSEVLLMK
jgi:outer membrane protein assembly factor BamB